MIFQPQTKQKTVIKHFRKIFSSFPRSISMNPPAPSEQVMKAM
jgi:hypothetical protein